MAAWSVVNFSKLTSDLRIDSEYYQPEYLFQEEKILLLNPIKLERLAKISDGNHLTISDQFLEDENEGIRYLRGQDLTDFFISDSNPVYIPNKAYEELGRSHIYQGDILLSIVGTVGNVGLVTDKYSCLTGSCKIAIIRPHSINPYILAAYLASDIGKAQIDRRVRGAVQQGLILPDLKEFPIPNISEEQAIEIEKLIRKSRDCQKKSESLYAEAEALLLHELGLDTLDLSTQKTYVANFSETVEGDRFDAEYFQPKYQRVMEIMSRSGQSLKNIARLAKRRFTPQKNQSFNYIEIGNLNGNGQADCELLMESEAPSRAQWIVRRGDIITSTVRPIRRLTALIEQKQDGYICSSGFAVLKPEKVSAEFLLVYLRLPIICEILDLHTTASMYPAISTDELLNIPITIPNDKIQQQIVEKVLESHEARQNAEAMLEKAKHRVEEMILG